MFRAYGTAPANASTVNTDIVHNVHKDWTLTNFSINQKKKGDYLII